MTNDNYHLHDDSPLDTEETQQTASSEAKRYTHRRKRRQNRRRFSPLWLGFNFILLVILLALSILVLRKKHGLDIALPFAGTQVMTETEPPTSATEPETTEDPRAAFLTAIPEAQRLAVQYDYAGAISLLEGIPGSEEDTECAALLSEYRTAQDSLVVNSPYKVTHVFFHSLVADPTRGFSIKEGNTGWNRGTEGFCEWMTTVSEFNAILEQMYARGYVLISIYDMVEEVTGEDGVIRMQPKDILLPEGKIPFVLSLDDLSYYHSYTGRGCATKMIVGEDGRPTCEYLDADGTTLIGSYDCIPLLDDFLDVHPDFSYKGAKGVIALTGYNGILGYRTDYTYRDRVNLDNDQAAWLNSHPDFDWDAECAEAKRVADAIKEDGWLFASHTWGHMLIGDASMDRVTKDTEKWENYVKPLVGDTDIIIFAHGQDLASWNEDYQSTEKFQYLKAHGFNIYCTVDSSSAHTVKFDELYMKQGRRNLDGYRLWQSIYGSRDKTTDLYDAKSVWDPLRPTDAELYDLQ